MLVTTDGEFPEGSLVKSLAGGVDALKHILLKLKRFKFTGYLKCQIIRDGGSMTGYLVVRDGAPVAAIYGRRLDNIKEDVFVLTKEGEDALKLIWGDSYDIECSIEVRGRVDVDKILDQYPNAHVNLAEKAATERRKRSKFALSWGVKGEDPAEVKRNELATDELKRRLENWRSSGYIVKTLESALDSGIEIAKVQFDKFEEDVKRLEFLRSELDNMELMDRDKDLERIKAMFKNPSKITAIEAAMEDLKVKMEAASEDEVRETPDEVETTLIEEETLEEMSLPKRKSPAFVDVDYDESIAGLGESVEEPEEPAADVEPDDPALPVGSIESDESAGDTIISTISQEPETDSTEPAPEHEEESLSHQGDIFPKEIVSDKCSVCGSDLRGKEECSTCGVLKDDTVISRPEQALTDTLASRNANLISDFSFESFVVGDSNRFSQAASLAVSKVQSSAYNPLFICSGAGLGKTHLLNAIGNYVVRNFEDRKVLYVTMENFINEFIEATKANKMAAFRKRYRKVDFLLLDDVHFIADQEAVQDELFHTFNALYKNGKQIVMSCDRPLREVQGLKERLVSRFEAGLVTDIQPPDFETRVAILRKKLERTDIDVDDQVLKFIAKRYTKNIRTLEGALSTLIAYCELMKKPPSIAAAIDALKEEPPDIPEEPELVLVPAVPLEQKSESLKISHSYLIEEERPVKCFELLVENLNMGFNALALLRMNPKRVRELYNVDDASVIWLTDREGDPNTTIAPSLEKIMYRIEDTLNAPGKTILLIDGLDYLISNNSFDSVLRFLRRLIDEVSESEAIFLMSLTPETIDEQGLKILEREMEIISFM